MPKYLKAAIVCDNCGKNEETLAFYNLGSLQFNIPKDWIDVNKFGPVYCSSECKKKKESEIFKFLKEAIECSARNAMEK